MDIDQLVKDDALGQFIRKDKNLFEFLMITAKEAINDIKYLIPNPSVTFPEITNDQLLMFSSSIGNDLNRIILSFNRGISDKQFFSNHSETFKKLMYFFIFFTSYSIEHIAKEDEYEYKKINLLYEEEQKFENEKLLFHGTKTKCLYSILRNSLKSMSGTEFMTTGAALGNGIYLSSNFFTSSAYTERGISEKLRTVLVCRVKNLNPTGEIYLQQEQDIQLCGMIIFKNILLNRNINHLRHFQDKMEITETNSQRVMKSRRFLKEMNRMMNKEIPEIRRIVFQSEEKPILFYVNPSEGTPLARDCEELQINGIVLSMTFPEKETIEQEYPMSPPVVRVLRPIFKKSTGRVSEGGSICLDSVFSSGWNPQLGIESLIMSIIDIISNESQENSVEKGGRIDRNKIGEEYSFGDFIRCSHNAALFHKWSV